VFGVGVSWGRSALDCRFFREEIVLCGFTERETNFVQMLATADKDQGQAILVAASGAQPDVEDIGALSNRVLRKLARVIQLPVEAVDEMDSLACLKSLVPTVKTAATQKTIDDINERWETQKVLQEQLSKCLGGSLKDTRISRVDCSLDMFANTLSRDVHAHGFVRTWALVHQCARCTHTHSAHAHDV
jgi:hypothetical protein